jgi:2-polyprenyl-3-methyl-5-hydroxy-6-metoxy-1,4-benzoquinol methylase
MTGLDRLIQRWRFAQAAPYVPAGARVLDIGTHDGALFRYLGDRISKGVGIDPELEVPATTGSTALIRGLFPDDVPEGDTFDVVCLLAVLEHIPMEAQPGLAAACRDALDGRGHVIVTTPSPKADQLLDRLVKLRLIHGMELGQHYGFEPAATVPLFQDAGFSVVVQRRFELGFNHLFVFERAG